jgi:predicted SAM-dependent methyltransferase
MEYGQALHCLRECHRVLRSGGRLRVATPSLQRLSRLYDGELTDVQRQYIDWAIRTVVEEPDAVQLPGFVLNNFFRAWGHRFIYDPDTLRYALERAGFADVEEQPVGESGDKRLAGLERHMRDAPELNEYETFVLEARRP